MVYGAANGLRQKVVREEGRLLFYKRDISVTFGKLDERVKPDVLRKCVLKINQGGGVNG